LITFPGRVEVLGAPTSRTRDRLSHVKGPKHAWKMLACF
jgi:hypothetical protein